MSDDHEDEESPDFVPINPPSKPEPKTGQSPRGTGKAADRQGSPAAQYAIGGLSVAVIAGTGAWQLGGPGLAAAAGVGIVAVAGGVAAYRRRRRHPRKGSTAPGARAPAISASRAGRPGRAALSARPSQLAGSRPAGSRASGRAPAAAGRRTSSTGRAGSHSGQARARSLPGRGKSSAAGRSSGKRGGRSWMHGTKPPWWVVELRRLLGLPLRWTGSAFSGLAQAVEEQRQARPAAHPPAEPEAAKEPQKTGDQAKTAPAAQPPAEQPAKLTPARTSTMSAGSGTDAVIEAIRDHVGGAHPENPEDLERFFEGLAAIYVALAEGLQSAEARLGEECAIEPATRERMLETAAATATLADHARETRQVYRDEHAAKIDRRENPLPGEPFFDVTNQ